jgi:hypothetical protein
MYMSSGYRLWLLSIFPLDCITILMVWYSSHFVIHIYSCISGIYTMKPHRWRNGLCATLEYGISLVRVPIWSNLDYEIGICCLSAHHVAIKWKSKDWLARNQDNMSEWNDMSIRGLLFQWDSIISIQLSELI